MPELGSHPWSWAGRPEKLEPEEGAGKAACLCLGSTTAGRVPPGSVFVEEELEQTSKCPALRSQPWH